MSLFFSSSNNSAKPSLAKKFKVGSQTQLKKITNTYWSKQLPKKGIKMKGEEGDLIYAKYPTVRAKVAQLLRKRGYISEATLQKDLIKDKVKSTDRSKVINALRGKFAKKEGGTLTPEQILANVKRSRAISRVMGTRGMSKAQEIEHGRHTKNIKEKFKEETYARLDVHGESHAISALGGQQVNPDDARYKEQSTSDKHATSAINQGPIKPVAGATKEISSGKDKETAIAAGTGLKKIEKSKDNIGEIDQNKGNSSSNNLISLTQAREKKIEDENNKTSNGNNEMFSPHISDRGPVFDSEWQGGVVMRKGKKAMHFPDLNENKPDPEIGEDYSTERKAV